MTPEQYLEAAEEHLAAGRFVEATAHASLAAAQLLITAQRATEPTPIYPGDHTPQPIPWCGNCHSSRRRITSDHQDCQCSGRGLRARPCRYCGTFLERRNADKTHGLWPWVDATGSVACSEAPDPTSLAPLEPEPTPDVGRRSEWRQLLDQWATTSELRGVPQSAAEICAHPSTGVFVPSTELGAMPHPRQLDHWLRARAQADTVFPHVIREVSGEDGDPRWLVEPAMTGA